MTYAIISLIPLLVYKNRTFEQFAAELPEGGMNAYWEGLV